MGFDARTGHDPCDGSVFGLINSDQVLIPTSILIFSALAVLPYFGNSLQYVSRYLLSIVWNTLIFFIPARIIFAIHTPEGVGPDCSLSTQNQKLLAANEVIKQLLKSDSAKLLQKIPLNPLSSTASTFSVGKASETPPGLRNPSNSCFQNSILQGLASLHSFQDFVNRASSVFGSSDTTTVGSLSWITQSLNDPEWQGRTLWTPRKLMPMNTIQQQDAQEYYSRIMEDMDKELAQNINKESMNSGLAGIKNILMESVEPPVSTTAFPSSIPGAKRKGLAPSQISQDPISLQKQTPAEARSSHLRSPVDGLLAQRLVCNQCQYSEGISLVPFNTLTVPLAQGSWRCFDIFDDCLHEYLKPEELEGVECAKCSLLAYQKVLQQLVNTSNGSHKDTFMNRLELIDDALTCDDFSEKTLVKRLGLNKKQWSRTTKTKQLAIARAPKSLIIHVQRSTFNPYTFRQEKNNSPVQFPIYQDISPFTLEARAVSVQEMVPGLSTGRRDFWLPKDISRFSGHSTHPDLYSLRAVVGHSGSHDYGHYVCYRKFRPKATSRDDGGEDVQPEARRCSGCHGVLTGSSNPSPNDALNMIKADRWWRLSDEAVWEVGENVVTEQANAFMLFYEREDLPVSSDDHRCQRCSDLKTQSASVERSETDDNISGVSQDERDSVSSDLPPLFQAIREIHSPLKGLATSCYQEISVS